MLLRLRRELDLARLDRATMLAALVELTASNAAIFAALAAKLQELETPRRQDAKTSGRHQQWEGTSEASVTFYRLHEAHSGHHGHYVLV
jgi:hypothetical protein